MSRIRKSQKLSLTALGAKVRAAQQEFDLAVTFHVVWKPTAYDRDLRERMGTSYATNAFQVVRAALRREMLLALLRLWDSYPQAVGMESIAETLRDPLIIDQLVVERSARIELSGIEK
jgi:hypothetical protein